MDWSIPHRYEKAYTKALEALMTKISEAVSDADDPHEIVRRLRGMAQSRAYAEYCHQLACSMVTNVDNRIKGRWRKAALINGKSRQIYEAITLALNGTALGNSVAEQVLRNAEFIVTLPQSIARQITPYIGEEAFTGRRSIDIANDIKAYFIPPNNKWANPKLIARTEVSKTQCALTKARAESLGLDWYIWRTSKDARVRSSHDIMDGVLVNWRYPPNPEMIDPKGENKIRENYHAGNIYNCRCYSEPVIDIEQITFPCKVHRNNSIQTMTRSVFMREYGIPQNVPRASVSAEKINKSSVGLGNILIASGAALVATKIRQ